MKTEIVDRPPVLETERLLLCGHMVAEFEPLAAMWREPVVVEHILAGIPSMDRDSWMRMLWYRGLWPLLGYGFWVIKEKSSGRYVGDLGFADYHRIMEPSIKGIPESGWALAGWAHGKGYATEALIAALSWLDGQSRHHHSVCVISPGNLASIRVAEKAGYRDPKPVRLNDSDTLLFTRLNPSLVERI